MTQTKPNWIYINPEANKNNKHKKAKKMKANNITVHKQQPKNEQNKHQPSVNKCKLNEY